MVGVLDWMRTIKQAGPHSIHLSRLPDCKGVWSPALSSCHTFLPCWAAFSNWDPKINPALHNVFRHLVMTTRNTANTGTENSFRHVGVAWCRDVTRRNECGLHCEHAPSGGHGSALYNFRPLQIHSLTVEKKKSIRNQIIRLEIEPRTLHILDKYPTTELPQS